MQLGLWGKGKVGDVELRIYPHGAIYSTSFRDLHVQTMQDNADRAGASKEEVVTEAHLLLKTTHGCAWSALDMVWRMWAADVVSRAPQAYKTTIEQEIGPP